jgi:hypothetical protein
MLVVPFTTPNSATNFNSSTLGDIWSYLVGGSVFSACSCLCRWADLPIGVGEDDVTELLLVGCGDAEEGPRRWQTKRSCMSRVGWSSTRQRRPRVWPELSLGTKGVCSINFNLMKTFVRNQLQAASLKWGSGVGYRKSKKRNQLQGVG